MRVIKIPSWVDQTDFRYCIISLEILNKFTPSAMGIATENDLYLLRRRISSPATLISVHDLYCTLLSQVLEAQNWRLDHILHCSMHWLLSSFGMITSSSSSSFPSFSLSNSFSFFYTSCSCTVWPEVKMF